MKLSELLTGMEVVAELAHCIVEENSRSAHGQGGEKLTGLLFTEMVSSHSFLKTGAKSIVNRTWEIHTFPAVEASLLTQSLRVHPHLFHPAH